MKRAFLLLLTGAVVVFALSSCAASKRDCQGVRHYKLKNGIYI
ncbi:MAG TPA: hypothetical protein VFS36_08805 [Chitinophagaceae bacterium]|nr:hypothetical protein [Chitinophagaceae bacterium]